MITMPWQRLRQRRQPADPEPGRCQAITKAGARCQLPASRAGHCRLHAASAIRAAEKIGPGKY